MSDFKATLQALILKAKFPVPRASVSWYGGFGPRHFEFLPALRACHDWNSEIVMDMERNTGLRLPELNLVCRRTELCTCDIDQFFLLYYFS